MAAIRAKELTKHYGETRSIEDLSFDVRAGDGEDRYPAVRETMIESVAAGLTTTDREQSDSKESGAGQ